MLYKETLNTIVLNTTPLNDYKKVCGSCAIYIILFTVFFIRSMCISSVFIYFHWYLKKSNTNITNNHGTETINYET